MSVSVFFINCSRSNIASDVAVSPTGTSYASGGEDGYVRLHHFDRSYFDFVYEVERESDAQRNGIGMVGVSA